MYLISNKSPNLHSVICSELNIASVTNKRLISKQSVVYEFVISLEIVTFYCKNILQFVIKYMWSCMFFKLLRKHKYHS